MILSHSRNSDWLSLLGDVAGKGVAAALLMVKFSVEARFCLLSEPDLAAALNSLNKVMIRMGMEDTFCNFGSRGAGSSHAYGHPALMHGSSLAPVIASSHRHSGRSGPTTCRRPSNWQFRGPWLYVLPGPVSAGG